MVSGRPSAGNSPATNFQILSELCDEADSTLAELRQAEATLGNLSASLAQEIAARGQAVAGEAQTRAQAIINAAQAWAVALNTESQQRIAAVQSARDDLGAAVRAEATARASALQDASTGIIQQLGDQITALSSSLRKAIGQEQLDRKNAVDGAVQGIGDRITALADDLSRQLVAVRAVIDARASALQSLLDERRYEFVPNPERPGDAPSRFTLVAGAPALGGPRAALPALPPAALATGDSGAVVRLVGSGLLATRNAFPLEPGRLCRLRYVVQRRANSSDPTGDAVVCGVVYLDQSLRVLGAPATARVYPALTGVLGRQECEALFSRSPGVGGTLVVPPDARFAVPYVQTFGTDPVTDVEVLGLEDVTGQLLMDAPTAAFEARLAALESATLAPRVAQLEQRVGNPSKMTFENRSYAAGATIPANVQVVELLGLQAAGDGGHGLFIRTATEPQPGDDYFTSGNAVFTRVRPQADVAAATLRAGYATYAQDLPRTPPPVVGTPWLNDGSVVLTHEVAP